MTMRDSIHAAQIGVLQKTTENSATQEFSFRADDPTFAGHFPTRPILPGVFQLEMTRVMAEQFSGEPLVLHEVTKAKFLWPIVPEQTIRVELKLFQKESAIQARATFIVSGRSAGETILQLVKISKVGTEVDRG